MFKLTTKQITLIVTITMTPLFIFFLWSLFALTPRQELVLQIDANSLRWETLNDQIAELKLEQAELQALNDELRASPVFTTAE